MTFTDFVHRMARVLQGIDNQSAFTKSLFEQIISEDQYDLFEGMKPSTWKSYFNGNANITRFAKKMNAYTDTMLFENYINEQEETAITKICDAFADELPDINMHNAGDLIARLFVDIIDNAAGGNESKPEKQKYNPVIVPQTPSSRADLSLDKMIEHIDANMRIGGMRGSWGINKQ